MSCFCLNFRGFCLEPARLEVSNDGRRQRAGGYQRERWEKLGLRSAGRMEKSSDLGQALKPVTSGDQQREGQQED